MSAPILAVLLSGRVIGRLCRRLFGCLELEDAGLSQLKLGKYTVQLGFEVLDLGLVKAQPAIELGPLITQSTNVLCLVGILAVEAGFLLLELLNKRAERP